MTHLSNNIQELHDKMQPSLSHTVDQESRFNGSEGDSFLDRALKRLTTEEKKAYCFEKFVSNNTMGSALKKHKKDGKKASNNNDTAALENHAANKMQFPVPGDLPVLIVSDTSTASESCVINCESSSLKSDNDTESLQKEALSEHSIAVKQESCSSQSQETASKLDPEEVNGQSKRDSAYGSSAESSCHAMPVEEELVSDVTASKASDPALDGSTSPHDCENSDCSSFLPGKDLLTKRNLSFSSLRSSLSLESEDDLDENTRPKTQIKPRTDGWKKIRQIIWSPFVQSFKKKYPWVQLAGHAGNFQPGEEGCILKKYVEREAECLKGLTSDLNLQNYAPTFHGIVNLAEEKYTRMQDLLLPFDNPSLMDCKMGIRTYLENELIQAREKPRLRHDMYKKMVEISPDEPTNEEREQQAITKPRYMQWREHVSSTSSLGFRIEGIKKSFKVPSKDYKLTKTATQVTLAFKYFIDNNVTVLKKYIERLKSLRTTLEHSDFFRSHEAIGSSLLFVHDDSGLANVWMIDFGKTSRLPDDQKVDHRSEWIEGNREDGYLFGVDNMVRLFEGILDQLRTNKPLEELTPRPASKLPKVDIIVTAPSPTASRRLSLRRQEAEFADDHAHHDVICDVTKTNSS